MKRIALGCPAQDTFSYLEAGDLDFTVFQDLACQGRPARSQRRPNANKN